MKRVGLFYALWVCVIALVVSPCLADGQKQEEDLGKEYAKQVEEQCKLVKDKAVSDRVDRIGQALAQIANANEVKASYGSSKIFKFAYHFKVIEDKDVNAFSLPGGYVYVNSGLVELAKSDDEIAGVLAHEIAHAAHHHMAQLIKKQSVVDKYVAIISLAGILSNMRSQDLNNLLYGAQLMKTGKMSSYTKDAERDADRTAVSYLVKSTYNPEGMLSFMKKLDAQHDSNPSLPLGIYEDHPAAFRRVASIAKALKEEGVAIDVRKARGFAYAQPVQIDAGDGSKYQVTIGGRVFYTPATLQAGATSKQRAENLAGAVNKLLDSGVAPRDLTEDKTGRRLLAKGSEILRVDAADAPLVGKNESEVLDQARSALDYAIWADWLCDKCLVVQQAADDDSD